MQAKEQCETRKYWRALNREEDFGDGNKRKAG